MALGAPPWSSAREWRELGNGRPVPGTFPALVGRGQGRYQARAGSGFPQAMSGWVPTRAMQRILGGGRLGAAPHNADHVFMNFPKCTRRAASRPCCAWTSSEAAGGQCKALAGSRAAGGDGHWFGTGLGRSGGASPQGCLMYLQLVTCLSVEKSSTFLSCPCLSEWVITL